MTILSKKKPSGTKDRREGGNGSEVDVHGVQNEHGSGTIALPNSSYQVGVNSSFFSLHQHLHTCQNVPFCKYLHPPPPEKKFSLTKMTKFEYSIMSNLSNNSHNKKKLFQGLNFIICKKIYPFFQTFLNFFIFVKKSGSRG